MNFTLKEAVEILERTPRTLKLFLSGLSTGWLLCDEGEGTWNASEVIDHLIEAENTNWIPRLEHILHHGESKDFPPFDRFAHIHQQHDRSIEDKLRAFQSIRMKNISKLSNLIDSTIRLDETGVHPAFGVVKVRELLSTWVVHDLTHISQIVRVMSKRYSNDVGPWQEYLGILKT